MVGVVFSISVSMTTLEGGNILGLSGKQPCLPIYLCLGHSGHPK